MTVGGNVRKLADFLCEVIKRHTPFSMIRVGDGEGRLLAYPWLLSELETSEETVTYMFGRRSLEIMQQNFGARGLRQGISTLQRLMINAISNADCLGLPAPVHFERYLAQPEGPSKESLRNGVLGMAGALLAGSKHFEHVPSERFYDTFIFKAVHRHRLFDTFLWGIEFLGLVSHTDFSIQISQRFKISNVLHVRVPGHQTFMPSAEVHFPECYELIVRRLVVPFKGAVFLVAAGYLGKVYCSVIKSRGGVAIDIGSVFDGWSGIGRIEMACDKSMAIHL